MGAKCVPSRATALTGRLQFAVESNYDGTDIEGNTYWFPTIRDKGYYTGMIGKWHYGKGAEAHQHGTSWDWSVVWDHGQYEAAGGYYYDQYVMINGAPQVPLGGYSTDRYTDYTEEFIRERAKQPDKPWFYWLCYGAVHGPYTPAERHQGMLEDKPETAIPVDVWGPRPGKPAHFQDSRWQKGEDGKPYRGGKPLDFWVKQQTEAVAAIDEGVGRIVKALEETGQLDNTIIVFTADQGYVWGHHGLKGKIDPYETAIRSPFIVSCPKRFPEGKVCKAPINGPDVIRTFHAWAEAEPRLFMPGRDITPLVMNPDSEPVLQQWSKVPTMMTYVHNRYEPMEMARRLKNKEWKACMYGTDTPWYFMILVENYKYTRYAHPDRIEELYDLDRDPEELDNLAVKEEFEDKLLEMRAACIQSIKDNGGSVFADYLPPPKTGGKSAEAKPSGDITVYHVEGKKRVHREGCRRLTTDPKILATMTKMTLAEAEAKGLPLCSRCPGSTTSGKGNP
jgi:arylsulfatase A-like enzyme